MKYIKLFGTHSEYEAYIEDRQNLVLPNVSYCEDTPNEVHYNPYIPPFFCKLTLNDGSVVDIEGSGELTSAMTASHKAACVSAEIGELCTSIGNYAFNNCKGLTSITIGNDVTIIGKSAFAGCSGLTNVTIGSGVTSIGNNAFNICTSLTSIEIPNSVTNIGQDAFSSCSGLTNVTIGSGVTSIGISAFINGKGLTSIEIPNSVTSIGANAFQRCTSLSSVTIGSGVTSIGQNAFEYCTSLTSVTVKATTPPTLGGSVFYDTNNCPIYVPVDSVATYQAASGWSTYASRIQAIQ